MPEKKRWVFAYGLLLVVAMAWNLAIIGAPWAWAQGHPRVASVLYFVFSPLCHQRADRSFFFLGHHLAVCARCAGIYSAALLGILVFPWIRLKSWSNEGATSVATAPSRMWLLTALALVAADVGGEVLGLRATSAVSRFLTGAFCGIVAPFYLLPALIEIVTKATGENRPTPLM